MSVQNKRVCIMSRQMVLRRILSNGDDRQADRLAQTLSLRRPGERPGQFLSLSVHPHPPQLSLSLCLSLSLTCLSLPLSYLSFTLNTLPCYFVSRTLYTRCKHSQRLISDLVEKPCRASIQISSHITILCSVSLNILFLYLHSHHPVLLPPHQNENSWRIKVQSAFT